MSTEIQRRRMQKKKTKQHLPPAAMRRIIRHLLPFKLSRGARVLTHMYVEKKLSQLLNKAQKLIVHDAVRHGRVPTGKEHLYVQDLMVAESLL